MQPTASQRSQSYVVNWSSNQNELKKQIKDYTRKVASLWGAATLHFLSKEYHSSTAVVHVSLREHLFALANKSKEAVVTRGQLFARNSQHLTPLQVAERFSSHDVALISFLKGQEAKIQSQLKADEQKSSPFVSFMANFTAEWDKAVKDKNWKALTVLVSSEKISFRVVYECVRAHIRSLAANFDGTYDERANQTHKALQAVAALTGSSLDYLTTLRGSSYLKEFVHANGKISNGVVGQKQLEFWDPLQFLPMHMLFLMRHAVALKSGWYENGRLPGILSQERQKILRVLETEIANEVLTYHCLRIANSLNDMAANYPGMPLEQMHALLSYKESVSSMLVTDPLSLSTHTFQYTLENQNTLEKTTGWITPDAAFGGVVCTYTANCSLRGKKAYFVTLDKDIALIKKQKELADLFASKSLEQRKAWFDIYMLFLAHARMVTRLVDDLNIQNPEFSYSTGCTTHSIEATFAYAYGTKFVRIDNRGLWVEENAQMNRAEPLTLGEILPKDKDRSPLHLYVIKLALALNETSDAKAKKMIYEPPQGVLKGSEVENALASLTAQTQWLDLDKQEINNCVHASHMLSMLQRLNAFMGKEKARALFEWLLSAEVVFSTTAPGTAMIGAPMNVNDLPDDW